MDYSKKVNIVQKQDDLFLALCKVVKMIDECVLKLYNYIQ